jgi:hypothetical protein
MKERHERGLRMDEMRLDCVYCGHVVSDVRKYNQKVHGESIACRR